MAQIKAIKLTNSILNSVKSVRFVGIMKRASNLFEKKCFIIDSKYYSYSMLRQSQDEENDDETLLVHDSIPGTDSIQKQIIYAQYIDSTIQNNNASPKNFRFPPENIYNVFILPENLSK